MSPLRYLLFPLAWLYGLIVRLRNLAYDRGWLRSYAVAVPVISVGNLSIGGTGKTPVAEGLLGHFQQQGLRAAYLSRGYGRRTKGYLRVQVDGNAALYGDEALQVARKFPALPVAVCEDRVAGAERLLAEDQIDLLILDDAFQHRRIRRDLDLVVIDGQRLPSHDGLLPMGGLREPCSHLRRADFLLVNKLYDPDRLAQVQQSLARYQRPQLLGRPVPAALHPWLGTKVLLPEQLTDRSVILLAGIGNPQAFRQQIEALGARVEAMHAYRDHRPFRPADFERLRRACQAYPGAWIVTTEKDLTRLSGVKWVEAFRDLPLYALTIEIAWWETPVDWTEALDGLMKGV